MKKLKTANFKPKFTCSKNKKSELQYSTALLRSKTVQTSDSFGDG